jgi:hypothetical protein
MSNQAKASNALLWVFIALYVAMAAARFLHNAQLQRFTPFISVGLLVGFALVHGIRRYGWRHLAVFFVLAFVISWGYETSSILTGFPFGHYIYTDKLGPKLWLVPLLIMPAYFSMGYIAWTLGHVLLDRFDDRLAGADVVLVPVLASFVMVRCGTCVLTLRARRSPALGSGAMAAATSACPSSTFSAGISAFSRFTWRLRCICGLPPSGAERLILASGPRGYCPRSCMRP